MSVEVIRQMETRTWRSDWSRMIAFLDGHVVGLKGGAPSYLNIAEVVPPTVALGPSEGIARIPMLKP